MQSPNTEKKQMSLSWGVDKRTVVHPSIHWNPRRDQKGQATDTSNDIKAVYRSKGANLKEPYTGFIYEFQKRQNCDRKQAVSTRREGRELSTKGAAECCEVMGLFRMVVVVVVM